MPLKAAEIDNLSCPENKSQIKQFDSNGLFLLIKRNGSKLWRFKYMYAGKHKELSFGKYPSISLKKARDRREEAKLSLSQGIDPSAVRKERKRQASESNFKIVAMQWLEENQHSWAEETKRKKVRWITKDCKSLSKLAMSQIEAIDIVDIMKSLKKNGHPKKAQPILSVVQRIFSYAIAHGHARHNPAQDLSLKDIIGAIPETESFSAITDEKLLGELMHKIETHERGGFYTRQALRLSPHIFSRPSEVRQLKWDYIDFDNNLIRFPEEIMKSKKAHLVPMSKQVVDQLKELEKYSGHLPYLFPNERNAHNHISKNVVNDRLRAMGYKGDVMTSHGFRGTASTILHEKGFSHDAVETQLAHLIGTTTSRAYNKAKYLKERAEMMQWWSDFLIELQEKFEQRL